MVEKEQIVVFLGQVTDSDQASLSMRTIKLKTKGQLASFCKHVIIMFLYLVYIYWYVAHTLACLQ